MEWALVNGLRAKAEKSGTVGTCPGCGGEVRAKCGEILVWHWAHINADCDPWSEPETEWHRKWKGYFPTEWQEVTKPPHRADVAGPDGVLEIQRSGISPEEIREREHFYGRMAWLLNGHDFWKNLEWIKVDGNYHEFRWKHARKTWITANRTIFIDTPLGLFRVKNIRDGSWKVVCGSFVKASSLIYALDRSKNTKPSLELLAHDAVKEFRREEVFKAAQQLIDLHGECESIGKILNPYCWRKYPVWTSYKTVYDYIKSAGINHAENNVEDCKQKVAHLHDLKLQHERKQLEKRAEIQHKQAEAHSVQQIINKIANERIAAAMAARKSDSWQ
jgi:competence protein CoiA